MFCTNMFRVVFSAFVVAVVPVVVVAEGPLGIPGTTQTVSGYDTELGSDPICWTSTAANTAARVKNLGLVFPNKLVEDFVLDDTEGVKLLETCPRGMYLESLAPNEFSSDEVMRTLRWYNYTVKGSIDVSVLNGMFIASDHKSRIAVQVIACDTLTAGFCSPFVHEQANARLAAAGITTKPNTGDRHGGTHVHSPSVFVELPIEADYNYEFEVDVPMLINHPGDFYVIGAMQFFTGDTPNDPFFRYDAANALVGEERLIRYQDPPTILEVTLPVRVLVYIAVAIVASVILYLLKETIFHYKSQVLQLSQAPFLVVFLLVALVATLATPLLEPRKDFMCLTSYPIILLSLQLLYAITIGRLWRIHAVISPLLRQRLQHQPSTRLDTKASLFTKMKNAVTNCFFCGKNNQAQQVTTREVLVIVVICTLPQIVFQILSLTFQPRRNTIEFNSDESVGRTSCVVDPTLSLSSDRKWLTAMASVTLLEYSFYILLLLIVVLLIVAHFSRKLPSLFDESQLIYDSTLMSVLLLILGLGVLAVTDSPTTSPEVEYIVWTIVILCSTLQITVRIMWPKLKMVWDGETVLVSKLVSDHRQKSSETSKESKSSAFRSSVVSGLNFSTVQDDSNPNSNGEGSELWSDDKGSEFSLEDSSQCGESEGLDVLSGDHDFEEDTLEDVARVPIQDDAQIKRNAAGIASSSTGHLALFSAVDPRSSIHEATAPNLNGGSIHDEETSRVKNTRTTDKIAADEKSNTAPIDYTPHCHDIDEESPAPAIPQTGIHDYSNPKEPTRKKSFTTGNSLMNTMCSSQFSTKPLTTHTADRDKGSTQPCVPRADRKSKKVVFDPSERKKSSVSTPKYVLKQGEAPSSRLILKMIDLQRQLDTVTTRVMSGLGVSEKDWGHVRSMTTKLETTFTNVQFQWEEGEAAVQPNREECQGLLGKPTTTNPDMSNNNNNNNNSIDKDEEKKEQEDNFNKSEC